MAVNPIWPKIAVVWRNPLYDVHPDAIGEGAANVVADALLDLNAGLDAYTEDPRDLVRLAAAAARAQEALLGMIKRALPDVWAAAAAVNARSGATDAA